MDLGTTYDFQRHKMDILGKYINIPTLLGRQPLHILRDLVKRHGATNDQEELLYLLRSFPVSRKPPSAYF